MKEEDKMRQNATDERTETFVTAEFEQLGLQLVTPFLAVKL